MLTTARTAINAAAADLSPFRLLWVGDSFLEGEGASALLNTLRMRTVTIMRALWGIKGAGLGLIPARAYATYRPASTSWRSPNSGTATTAPNWNISQGLKGVRFTALGQYREWALTGTAVDICYLQAAGAGGGNINVSLAGTAQTPINANDSGQTYQPSKLARYTRAGGRGAMTTRVTAAATQGIVDGVVHYDGDDVGGGIIGYDCTRTGAQSNVIAVDEIISGWTAIQPHLVIDDQVGSNDYLDGAADPATVVARLNTRLDAYAALASQPTVVVLIPWRLPATAGTIAGRTYEQYVTAVKAACASHAYAASIKVLDLQAVYPDAASQPWHDADALHPNDTGHQKIAEAVVAFVDQMDGITGTLTATLPRMTAAVGGESRNEGTLAAALPRLTSSIAGTSTNPGTVAAALPRVTAAVTGTAVNSGTVDAQLPRVTSSIVDTTVVAGVLAATLPRVTAAITGQSVNTGSLDVILPRLVATIEGTTEAHAALIATLPRLVATILGTQTNHGTLAATLPRPTAAIAGTTGEPPTPVRIRVVDVTSRTRSVQITSRTRAVTIEEP